MTPETWAVIRQDWRESLPSVLDGTDDRFYPVGWATDSKIPRTLRTSLRYLCSCMKWDWREILGRRKTRPLNLRRESLTLALRRRHSNKTLSQLADMLNRDDSSIATTLKRAREREQSDSEFADLVKRLECLI